MTIKGRISNGTIVLDKPVRLPEGTRVVVRPVPGKIKDPTGIAGTWVDKRSAEEIIKDIHQARRSRRPVS